jgi:hypothetical protein
MCQTVNIPLTASTATLGFLLRITTSEGTAFAYDKLSVQLRNSSGSTVLKNLFTFTNQNKADYAVYTSTGFKHPISVDMSPYRGQSISVCFLGQEDYSLATTFDIDNAILNVSTSPLL